jgi:acyl transferase domain-containing protein
LREPVQYGAGVEQVLELGGASGVVLVEVGPGRGLTGLAGQVAGKRALVTVLLDGPAAAPRTGSGREAGWPDQVWRALAQVWTSGGQVHWPERTPQPSRLHLPTYPFERQHFWIEKQQTHPTNGASNNGNRPKSKERPDIADWFYVPIWKQSVLPRVSLKTITQNGCWLVFAHEGSLTSSLVRRLTELGNDVVTVEPGASFARLDERLYTINHRQKNDYETLLEEIRQRHGPPRNILHLWSITPNNAVRSSTEAVSQLQSLGFYSLLFLAQAWQNLGEINQLQLAVVSNDMQGVVGEEELWPEKATVLGPCKVIPQEYAGISCMSIDISLPEAGSLPEMRLTEQLLAEFTSDFTEPVAAYRGGSRWVQRFEAVRIDATGEEMPRLRSHGNYLITGGLGGLGLTLAEHLAQSVKARLVLLGRSTFPERDEWANWLATHDDDDEVSRKIEKLKMLEQHGAEILVLSADVTDEASMRAAVARARERFGELNGVIHAAGIPGAGIIQLKTPDMAAEVLSPKLQGTLVLEKIFEETPLDFLMLCSSTSSILGGAGGVDYCAANAFLNAYAQSRWARPGVFTVSVAWNKWLEVGMAARSANRPQVTAPGQIQKRLPFRTSTRALHPIFDLRVSTEVDHHAYLTRFNVGKHWVLNEHRIRGHAVIPGTAYLEMARAAFEEIAGTREIEISDAVFVAPLLVNDDKDAEVRTSIHKNGVGYRFLIESKSEPGVDAEWTAHASGGIKYLTEKSDANNHLKDLIKTCEREGILIEGKEHYRELGPRWHNLKKIYFGEDEGIAALELSPEYQADLERFKLHPSILDMSTGFLAARFLGEGDYLPFLYRSLRIKASLPRKVYSYVKYKRSASKETVSFDVVIADESGAELVSIGDFMMKRVGSVTSKLRSVSEGTGARTITGRSITTSVVTTTSPGMAQTVAGEGLAGILPPEGAEAFSRILLHSAMPQVFVAPQDLPALVQHFNSIKVGGPRRAEVEQSSETRQAHARPELQQEYVAPRSEVEETIAGIWRVILGIDQIGVDDNFFDLGGDSLIALQLSTRLRDAFRVEPSVSGVFDSPTVAGLAVLVAQSAAESVDNELLAQLLNELEA